MWLDLLFAWLWEQDTVFPLSYVISPVFTRGDSDLCENPNYPAHRSWQVTSFPSSPPRVQTGLKKSRCSTTARSYSNNNSNSDNISSSSTTRTGCKWLGNKAYAKTTKAPKAKQEKRSFQRWIKPSSCHNFFGCKVMVTD